MGPKGEGVSDPHMKPSSPIGYAPAMYTTTRTSTMQVSVNVLAITVPGVD